MSNFANSEEAKEFLVSRIASEAQLEGIPLSETERKELYLSETAWTLPNMAQINKEFEQTFDQDSYEDKIVRLIKAARNRDREANVADGELWAEAIGILSNQDHYILVMIRRAGLSTRPRGDLAKLWSTAVILVMLLVFLILVAAHFNIDTSKEAMRFYLWAGAAATAVCYVLISVVLGQERTNRLVGRVVEKTIARCVRIR